ncbi:hypothetical protein ACJ41O_010952 [Fusarium nematophilum]
MCVLYFQMLLCRQCNHLVDVESMEEVCEIAQKQHDGVCSKETVSSDLLLEPAECPKCIDRAKKKKVEEQKISSKMEVDV